MQWANTKAGYGWASIILHWAAFFAVIAMFWTGLAAAAAGDAGDRAARGAYMGLHISIGASVALILLARVLASYAQPKPAPLKQAAWLNTLATGVHHLLLLALLIQIVSGPLAVWSGGRAIGVFDLFEIPSPFAQENEAIHEAAETAHLVGRVLLFFLIPIHILGTLKHAMMDEDGVLRMLTAPKN